ncbi:MAG: hypothetical protein Q7S40_33490 [Opitutaceae bacterium]|nr:hypothetical protein [Opitutaceae bacterium]
MKACPSRWSFLVAITLCIAIPPRETFAQAVTPSAVQTKEGSVGNSAEVVELSPFMVPADSEVGYVATSSLVGTRTRTELKDIASQIDVMTPEFLNDIAATNIADAVMYSSNFGAPNDQNGNGAEMVSNTRLEARARSMDAATSSSDFFATNLPNDLYNVERLNLAYGAQSVLFGLGNTGGVLDSATKRATMKRSTSLGFQVDSWGSNRATLDANLPLIPRKLAVRVAALYGDGSQFTEGSLNRQMRIYGTSLYRPLPSTTVRVSFERIEQTIRRASNFIAYDFVSPWIDAGRPLFDNSRGNAAIAANHPLFTRNTNALNVVTYGGAATFVMPWSATVVTKGPHELPGIVDPRRPSLRDDRIFPSDIDPKVSARENDIKGHYLRAFVEQKITPDLFFELGFNYEKREELSGGPFDLQEALNIRIDPNLYLPGGTAAVPSAIPNPNVGRLYMETFPHGRKSQDETKEVRLTGFYEFDAGRKLQGALRWIGRHRLATLLSWREDREGSQEVRAVIAGDTSFTTGDALNNSRLQRVRFYLDSPSGPDNRGVYRAGAMHGETGSSLHGPWTFTDARGAPYQVHMFDHPAGSSYVPNGIKVQDATAMAAWQGFFLKDRINVFVGLRKDRVKSYDFRAEDLARTDQIRAGDRLGMFKPLSAAQFDSTPAAVRSTLLNTYGFVARPISWLTLFYNKSENTALPPGYFGPYGNALSGTSSHGYDTGIRLDSPGNRASVRLNFYKDTETDFWGNPFQGLRDQSAVIEQRLRGPDRPAGIGNVPAAAFDPVANPVSTYRSLAAKSATGLDVVLVAAVTPQWDLRFTVGKQYNTLQSRGTEWQRWISERLPVWQSAGGLGWDNVTVSPTDSRTLHQYYDQIVVPTAVSLEAAKGVERFRERKWRANLFTSYRFTSERLKGVRVGGGARWLGPGVIGSGRKIVPGLAAPIEDSSVIFKGPSQLFIDAFAGYRRPVKLAGANVMWNVQLNIRNLFNDYPTEIARADADGIGYEYVRVSPRQVMLQTGLAF